MLGVHVTILSNYKSGRSQPTVSDKELLRQWESIEELPDEDRQAVKRVVAAMIVKQRVEQAIK